MAQISTHKCNACPEKNKNNGDFFCKECVEYMCHQCRRYHDKYNKGHTLTDSQSVNKSVTKSKMFCESHDLGFLHFCENCKCLTCPKCTTTDHQGHLLIDISTKTKSSRDTLHETCNNLKSKSSTLSDMIEQIKSGNIPKIKEDTEMFTKHIKAAQSDFKTVVNEVAKIYKTRADDFFILENERANQALVELEKQHDGCKTEVAKIEGILMEKHDLTFYIQQENYSPNLELMVDIPDVEIPRQIEDFDKDKFKNDVFEKMETRYTSSRNKSQREKKILVAAIDCSTTYSGYALSSRYDFKNDPGKVFVNPWQTKYGRLYKTSTSILLDPATSFHSFGYDAEDKYTELEMDDEHHVWYFFKRFKMMLNEQQGVERGVERDMMLWTHDGKKKLPALTIFSMAIRYLKDHVLSTSEKLIYGVRLDDIHWVLTVPAIWNDPCKQLMRKAAEQAGIQREDLSLTNESEALAMFCEYIVEEIKREPGNRYIVLNGKDETVDITVNQVQKDQYPKELFSVNGIDIGATQIDEAFKQLLIRITGPDIYLKWCENNAADCQDMFSEFELKKRNFREDDSKLVPVWVFSSLRKMVEEDTNKTLEEVISQSVYSGQLKWLGDKLIIESNLFSTLFEMAVGNVIEHLKKLLKEHKITGTQNLIMLGGFFDYPIVQAKIEAAFPDINVIIPSEFELPILKGAVIFGHIHQHER